MMTQEQMYWKAHDRIAGQNEMFLLLVDEGMTREELEKNIERRPALWGRFSGWLEKLPSSTQNLMTVS